MTGRRRRPTVAGMATAPTADTPLAATHVSPAAGRYALAAAALLALAGAGFATARSLVDPAATRPAHGCSETCSPPATIGAATTPR